MYLINKNNINDRITVNNPNEKHNNKFGEKTENTNLQYTLLSIKPEARRDLYFQQETLPDCAEKYWKISNDQVVEMNAEEKAAVDKALYLAQRAIDINWEFTEKNIRVGYPYTFAVRGGVLYNAGLQSKMLAKGFEKFNVYDPDTEKSKQYLETIEPADLAYLQSVEQVTIERLDVTKPFN